MLIKYASLAICTNWPEPLSISITMAFFTWRWLPSSWKGPAILGDGPAFSGPRFPSLGNLVLVDESCSNTSATCILYYACCLVAATFLFAELHIAIVFSFNS